tara:strand:- start:146 stop:349 length:204 start_codon:yes stop_codon:yes gene_type:complete
MRNFLLTLSVAIMAGSIGCLGYGVSEMANFDKSSRSLTTREAVNLFLGGFIGAHLAAAPLMIASKID